MLAVRCSCGFAELDDESITDHLNAVFTPDDLAGNDGQVHEERARLTCLCGLIASTPGDLDAHFIKVFTPDDAIGRDGKKHVPRGASREAERHPQAQADPTHSSRS